MHVMDTCIHLYVYLLLRVTPMFSLFVKKVLNCAKANETQHQVLSEKSNMDAYQV